MPKKKNGQTVSEVDPSFGPQMNIPNRAERKALLEELEKAHEQGREESIPGYGAYAEKFKALDRLMDEYSELDPWGLPKELTADQKAAFDRQVKQILSYKSFIRA